MTSLLARHGKRLVRHGGWMTLAALALWAVRTLVPHEVLSTTGAVGGNVLQTFGGMYGVIVAFAIFITWQQHNETQIAIEREAVSLVEVYRAMGWFESWAERGAVRVALHRYALAVPANYGPRRAKEIVDEAALLETAQGAFLRHAPSSPREERVYDHTLALFHELNEARAHRETIASLRLPDGMRWFVFLGGALCVLTVDLMWVPEFLAHLALTLSMTWVAVAAASTVVDLDDPFEGDFVVEWDRLEVAARAMERISGGDRPVAPVT
jgi:Protein of unknown function (DUF4239)